LADEKVDLTSIPGVGPAISKVASAELPGFFASKKELQAEQYAPLRENARGLLRLGLGIYSAKGGRIVFFNPAVLRPEEVRKIDEHGAIDKTFPPLSEIGADAGPTQPSAAPAASPAPVSAPMGTPVPPAPGGAGLTEKRLTAASSKKQTIPGGGSILNGILKSAA
jgi:hypothetical protein